MNFDAYKNDPLIRSHQNRAAPVFWIIGGIIYAVRWLAGKVRKSFFLFAVSYKNKKLTLQSENFKNKNYGKRHKDNTAY
jgi:hypothetical protein